ncbi:MAG: hypothetical protein ACYCW6_28335 [Candidatus Xenobia bacterium]
MTLDGSSLNPARVKLLQAAYPDASALTARLTRDIVPVDSVSQGEDKLGNTLRTLLSGEQVPSADLTHARAFLEEVDRHVKHRHQAFLNPDDKLKVAWVTEDNGILALGLNVEMDGNPYAGITTYVHMAEQPEMYISPLGHPRVEWRGPIQNSGNNWNFEHSHIRF